MPHGRWPNQKSSTFRADAFMALPRVRKVHLAATLHKPPKGVTRRSASG